MEDNIENEYRKRFSDYEEEPADELWKNIQKQIQPNNKPEKPFGAWWRFGLAALVLLMIGTYFFKRLGVRNQELVVNSRQSVKVGSRESIVNSELKNNVKVAENLSENKSKNEKKATKIFPMNKEKNIAKNQINSPENEGKNTNNLLKNQTATEKNYNEILQTNEGKFVVKNQSNYAQNVEKSTNNIVKKNDDKTILENEKIANNQSKFSPKNEILKTNNSKKIADNKEVIKDNSNLAAENKSTNNESLVESNVTFKEKNVVILPNENSKINDEKVATILPEKNEITDLNFLTLRAINLPKISINFGKVLFENNEEIIQQKLTVLPPSEVFLSATSIFNYYEISPNQNDNLLLKNIDASSKRLSFATQAGILYPLTKNKKLNLRLAIGYAWGESIIRYVVIDPTAQNTVTSFNNNSVQLASKEKTAEAIQQWQNVGVQGDLLYKFSKIGAISLGFRAAKQLQNDNNAKPLYDVHLGYRFSRVLSQKTILWVEPSISSLLTSSVSSQDIFTQKITNFGVSIGVSWVK